MSEPFKVFDMPWELDTFTGPMARLVKFLDEAGDAVVSEDVKKLISSLESMADTAKSIAARSASIVSDLQTLITLPEDRTPTNGIAPKDADLALILAAPLLLEAVQSFLADYDTNKWSDSYQFEHRCRLEAAVKAATAQAP